MNNLWENIAKERGVALEEKFEYILDNTVHSLRITNKGLFEFIEGNPCYYGLSTCLNVFIIGKGEIKKLPFEPKNDEVYWTININRLMVEDYLWDNHVVDYNKKLQGTVFRTKEEAEKALAEHIEKLKAIGYKGE